MSCLAYIILYIYAYIYFLGIFQEGGGRMFPPPPSLPFKMKPNIGSLQNSTSLYWSPQLHILLYLRLIWQRTLESSECAQSTVLESKGQSTSLSSVPVHRTSSKTIGPLPCPKKANERAVASVHQRREEMLTRVVLIPVTY